jgi:hypothetical protein
MFSNVSDLSKKSISNFVNQIESDLKKCNGNAELLEMEKRRMNDAKFSRGITQWQPKFYRDLWLNKVNLEICRRQISGDYPEGFWEGLYFRFNREN